jgi:hypothetical protein
MYNDVRTLVIIISTIPMREFFVILFLLLGGKLELLEFSEIRKPENLQVAKILGLPGLSLLHGNLMNARGVSRAYENLYVQRVLCKWLLGANISVHVSINEYIYIYIYISPCQRRHAVECF